MKKRKWDSKTKLISVLEEKRALERKAATTIKSLSCNTKAFEINWWTQTHTPLISAA